jgi:hypothetical protein
MGSACLSKVSSGYFVSLKSYCSHTLALFSFVKWSGSGQPSAGAGPSTASGQSTAVGRIGSLDQGDGVNFSGGDGRGSGAERGVRPMDPWGRAAKRVSQANRGDGPEWGVGVEKSGRSIMTERDGGFKRGSKAEWGRACWRSRVRYLDAIWVWGQSTAMARSGKIRGA